MEQTIVEEAEDAFRKGRTDEALELLNGVLEKAPDNRRALMSLGTIRHSQGRLDEAAEAFGRLTALEPDNQEALKNLALTHLTAKDNDRARTCLEKLVALNQSDHVLWGMLARLETAAGRTEAALEHARRSLLLNHDQPELRAFVSRPPEGASEGAPGPVKKPPAERRLIVACPPDRDREISLVVSRLAPALEATKAVSLKVQPYLQAAAKRGMVWLEGLGQVTRALLVEPGLLADRRVLLDLKAEEVLAGLADPPDLSLVSDVVVESVFSRDRLVAARPALKPGTRLHVVPRPIDTETFKFRPSPGGAKIAAPGPHGPLSGLMDVLSAFRDLKARRDQASLHISGPVADPLLELAMGHFVMRSGLKDSVYYQKTPADLHTFLADKDYVLCCPLAAGLPGAAEAVLLGLKPLLKDVPGHSELISPDHLWHTSEELLRLFDEPPDALEASRLAEARHDPARVAKSFLRILTA
jgi:tetratricopeptide (TPR) repeat protein